MGGVTILQYNTLFTLICQPEPYCVGSDSPFSHCRFHGSSNYEWMCNQDSSVQFSSVWPIRVKWVTWRGEVTSVTLGDSDLDDDVLQIDNVLQGMAGAASGVIHRPHHKAWRNSCVIWERKRGFKWWEQLDRQFHSNQRCFCFTLISCSGRSIGIDECPTSTSYPLATNSLKPRNWSL